jgi:alpha-L-rhamnosidase
MMKKRMTTLLSVASAGLVYAGGGAHSLTVGEGFVDPVGYHNALPTFSWKLPAGVGKQTAYRVEVKGETPLWDSGWVESGQSVFVPYGGDPLHSRQQLEWRVRFRDETGKESGWSKFANCELGLLSSSDWKAQWIRPQAEADPEKETVAWLRREFPVSGKIAHARLYVAARGVFDIQLNGKKVGNDHFANGWTSYTHRLDTLTYDVTDQLKKGENAVSVMLGTGWYAGRIGWKHQKGLFGRHPELLLQLEITRKDGSVETIVSDGSWQATFDGPVLSSSLYDGEHYDARKEVAGWSGVVVNPELGSARLVPKPFAPVRATETRTVRNITEPEPGRFVFDLGQNMVGWARIRIPVEKDQTTTIRFAEMLNTNGTLYTENYRSAKSTDFYSAAETGTIEWEPTFTFHGFRYVELSGLPAGAKPNKNWVKGIVLHSDLPRIGSFESSHEKLNQLQSNIVWGQRGNFLDIPTDCPQRDERLGWTGDAQAFCPTSMFNYDCHAFWKSWLGSMRDDQMPDGRIPHVIPDALGKGDSPGWMDAATIIPWEVYVRTGDIEMLADNYKMMERLVCWYRSMVVDGLTPEIKGFGDWLQPYSKNTKGDTPHPLLGLAFYAKSCRILADSARVLERDADAKKYDAEASALKQSFARHYFDGDGKLQNAPETQTAYLLAIEFDLIPEALQKKASAHLVRLIGEADGHLRTGFLGTPFITRVLDSKGYPDLAFDLLFKETYPSWFYSINQGATTMWERWNSYSHKDGFGPVGMNSFNHYAYGAIGQWMYERVAGLAPDPGHPGYKHFFVRPIIGNRLEWAHAELETPYGKAFSGWKKEDGRLIMEVVVPPNTTATIEFPNGRKSETVLAGTYRYELEDM